jgi:hypothetical protein
LIKSGEIYFLSRPRRFGKSLLVSTLKEIFLGNRELFRELYIYDKIEWQQYPVVHIDFSVLDYNNASELKNSLFSILDSINKEYKLSVKKESLKIYFEKVIKALAKIHGKNVVLLIDEYDKPIIDFISETDIARENRDLLGDFYSVLKGMDAYLHFVLITGVSRFSKESIFSGLNNFLDITLDKRFSTMPGITKSELNDRLIEYVKTLAGHENERLVNIEQKIKK